MSEIEIFKEAMRMSYKFTLNMVIILSILLGLLSYCIIKYNSDKIINIETTATQTDSDNSVQEVRSEKTNNKN